MLCVTVNLQPHDKVVLSCFYHRRNIPKIRMILHFKDAETCQGSPEARRVERVAEVKT